MRKVIIETENAGCYANKLLPVIAPFLCKQYWLKLLRLLQSKTGDGKGPADIHFATEMKFGDRLI